MPAENLFSSSPDLSDPQLHVNELHKRIGTLQAQMLFDAEHHAGEKMRLEADNKQLEQAIQQLTALIDHQKAILQGQSQLLTHCQQHHSAIDPAFHVHHGLPQTAHGLIDDPAFPAYGQTNVFSPPVSPPSIKRAIASRTSEISHTPLPSRLKEEFHSPPSFANMQDIENRHAQVSER